MHHSFPRSYVSAPPENHPSPSCLLWVYLRLALPSWALVLLAGFVDGNFEERTSFTKAARTPLQPQADMVGPVLARPLNKRSWPSGR
jgi:hypothetical protein